MLLSKRQAIHAVSVAVGVIAREGDVMDDMWVRIADDLAARVSGPMKFRLVLQPIMATFFAIRSGLADAKAGKPPYLWTLVSAPAHRADMIKDGWQSVGKVFVLAVMLDVVYQIVVSRFVYPGEAIIVAFILAIAPYLLLRGLVTRLARANDVRRQLDSQISLTRTQGVDAPPAAIGRRPDGRR